MNCAESLSSQLGVWRMSSCMRPTMRMSLLMSLAYITLCVRWFFCKDFELVVDYWDECEVSGCEGMYMFITSSDVSGLLDILMTSRYGDMFLGVGILILFSVEYMFSWIMARVPPLGGLHDVNFGYLCRFVSFA